MMATSSRYASTKERVNYGRSCRIIVDLCADVLRKILTALVVPSQLLNEVGNCSDLKRLAADEVQRINLAVARTSYGKFDISFLYKLICAIGTQGLRNELDRNIQANSIWTKLQSTMPLMTQLTRKQCITVQNATDYSGFDCELLTFIILNLTSINIPNIIPTANEWGGKTLPNSTNIKLGDDIERIRFIQNTVYGHVSDICITDSEFQKYLTELTGVMQRMDQEFSTGGQYLKDLKDIETASLDDKWEMYESTIRDLVKGEQEIKDRLAIQEECTQQLQTDVQEMENRLEKQDDSAGQLQKDFNQMESRLEKEEDSTGQLQKSLSSLNKSIAEMGGKVDVMQSRITPLSLAQELALKEKIGKAKQYSEVAKQLLNGIKQTSSIAEAEKKESEIRKIVEEWKAVIRKAASLKDDMLSSSLDLEYLRSAEEYGHEHNIRGFIHQASMENKLKQEVRDLLKHITTAKQLWGVSKDLFEEIKTEYLLEKADNKLRELKRKEDRWIESIDSAVRLENKLQDSRQCDAEPFTPDALEKELQRIQPCEDFKYLQYLQDAQKPEHEQNIHRVIDAASIEIKLKKEEISPRKLEDWKQSDKTFYPTKATAEICKKVQTKKKVIASGLPGSGKTAAIHHIALKLKNEGYRLCCVEKFNELKCKMDKFQENEKQVYVIDDVFGVHGVDELKRKQWCDDNKDEVRRCLNNPNISILCSSRIQVLNDDQLKNIKSRFTNVNISEGAIGLSKDERAGIFRNHAVTKQRIDLLTEKEDQLKDVINEKVREVKCSVGCFPLVCHLFTGDTETEQTIEEYFNKPLNVIEDHLEKLQVEDHLSHFCLLLCLIYENKLPVKTMKVGKEEEETKKKREELLEICELSGSTSCTTIKNKMDTLLQTFIKREGDTYQFVHDIVHDAVIRHIGSLKSDVLEVILRHCKVLLCVACNRGCDTEVIQALIHAGADVNTQDVFGRYALGWSVAHNDYETTQLLLDHKADVNLCDNQGKTALHQSTNRSYKITQLLLDHKADANLFTNKGWLALHRCVDKGFYKTTKLLLDYKADVNLCNDEHVSVLHRSVDKGDYKTTQLLLDYKADVNLCTNNGWSALHRSVEKGDYKTTQLLLDYNADVNLCTNKGWSAVHRSVYKKDYKTTQLLLDHKADVNLCNYKGRSALHGSVYEGDYKTTQLLLDHNADVNLCTNKGWLALHRTVYNGDYETTQLLLNHMADVNLCTYKGWSALYMSVYKGDYKTTQLLLDHKADVNLCTNKGWSALYTSVYKGDYKTTQLLLDHKADVNLCTNQGCSILYRSQLARKDNITELLLSYDAVCLYKGKQYNHVIDIPGLPLCDCIYHNNYQAVKILIERGTDVNQCDDEYGWSPLFISQVMEQENITSLLLLRDAVCLYKGKHYNYATDIPDCEINDVEVLVGNEFVQLKKIIQELRDK